MLTWARAPQDGWTSLISAANCGHAPVVKVLLDAGADKNAKNKVRGSRGAGLTNGVCFSVDCIKAADCQRSDQGW